VILRYDFYASRSPDLIHQGNGFYAVRYSQNRRQNRPGQRYPYHGGGPSAYQGAYPSAYQGHGPQEEQQNIYYYRPASSEKVRVTPIGSFDVSLEEDGESVRPVVSPFHYYKKKVQRNNPTRVQVLKRRPVPTPVVHQRRKQRREERQIKKEKNVKKVNSVDKKVKKRV
jgi:hypothetical protein